jgi:hypothetical protein
VTGNQGVVVITNHRKQRYLVGLLVLLALLWSASAGAFERNSFRLRGMGTGLSWMVDDSFTDIFNNPATMVELKGLSIYTNLSNIEDQGNTSFLSGQDATRIDPTGTLLLGGHWVNEEQSWGVGLFVEWGDIRISGKSSTLGSGSKSPLGNFDTVVEEETLDYETIDVAFNDLAILLPFSMRVSRELTIGTLVMFEDFSGSVKLGSESGSEQLMQVGQFSELRRQFSSSSYETSFDNNMQIGGLAGMRYVPVEGDYVLEAVVGYAPTQLNVSALSLDTFVGGTNMGLILAEATQYANEDGFDIYASAIQAHVKATFKVTDEIRLTGIVGYEMVSHSPEISATEFSSYTSERELEGYRYSATDTTHQQANMDAQIHHIPIRLGVDWSFVDWGTFALGVNTYLSMVSVDYVSQPDTNTQSFNYKLPPFDHPYVSEIFSSTNEYQQLHGDAFGVVLSVPVGVEVNPSDWFTFRMGAETFIPLVNQVDISGYSYDEPDYTEVTTSAAQGGVVGSVKSDEAAPVVRAKEKVDFDSADDKVTVYSAGLGVKFNDNLRLDALSFAELTDLSFWKFSLSFDYQF